jgi:hypothetical protein
VSPLAEWVVLLVVVGAVLGVLAWLDRRGARRQAEAWRLVRLDYLRSVAATRAGEWPRSAKRRRPRL